MPRITKEDLIDEIEGLRKQNERLVQDRLEYFDLMTNAHLESERLKKQLAGVEQLEFDRDELLMEVDSLRAELEETKVKLKKARSTATKYEHALNELKQRYTTARHTVEIYQVLVASRDEEIERLKAILKSRKSSFNNSESINEQPIPENPKRGRPVTIMPHQRENIVALREQKCSILSIAQEVGISVGSVQRILNEEKASTEITNKTN